jgi:hypothetical protein
MKISFTNIAVSVLLATAFGGQPALALGKTSLGACSASITGVILFPSESSSSATNLRGYQFDQSVAQHLFQTRTDQNTTTAIANTQAAIEANLKRVPRGLRPEYLRVGKAWLSLWIRTSPASRSNTKLESFPAKLLELAASPSKSKIKELSKKISLRQYAVALEQGTTSNQHLLALNDSRRDETERACFP